MSEIKPYDEREFVWEQRWRCSTIEEIALPPRIKDKLLSYTQEKRIPCLLLNSRSPGTGKTTTAYAVAKSVNCLKPLYINASLDTDVANIRTKVFNYATGQALNGGIKVVILDEAERLSSNAQESLKGLIEQVSRNCVFILTTNNKNKLVEPLRSRCRVIDYEWSDAEKTEMIKELTKRTVDILKFECVGYNARTVFELVQRCFPDNRRLLGTLQDYAQIHGNIDEGVLVHNQKSDFGELVRIMRERNFKSLKQWVSDYSDLLGPDFCSNLCRYLITPRKVGESGKYVTIVADESITDVIEFLGEEQKYHDVADKWLFTLRVLTVLMITGGIKLNPEFSNVE